MIDATDFPQIVAGTYEEFVLGYKPETEKEKQKKLKLHQTFATHSHQASVRCIAANERYMVSSGADEYINIYDMVLMKVSKVINYHDATVTCLQFTPDDTHLITGNQKGDIAIFRCKDWTLVKLWKEAHKSSNGVTSMSVHPTGCLLLTTGADNILRFWNLVKGRQAYATNYSKAEIGSSLNYGSWSPSGKYYIVCIGKQLEVYKTQTAAVIYKVIMNSKITCVTFCKKTLVCVGNEEGNLEIHSLIHKSLFAREEAHKARLKCASAFNKTTVKNDKTIIESYLVTADSQGVIKLWCLKKKGLSSTLLLKAEVKCDCRITCLSIVPPKNVKLEKQNNETTDHEENDTKQLQEETAKKINSSLSVLSADLKSKKLKKKKNKIEKIKQNGLGEEKLISGEKKSFQNEKKSNQSCKRTLPYSSKGKIQKKKKI